MAIPELTPHSGNLLIYLESSLQKQILKPDLSSSNVFADGTVRDVTEAEYWADWISGEALRHCEAVSSKNRSISLFDIRRWRSAREGLSKPRLTSRRTDFSETPRISAASFTLNARRRSRDLKRFFGPSAVVSRSCSEMTGPCPDRATCSWRFLGSESFCSGWPIITAVESGAVPGGVVDETVVLPGSAD